jgi:hypothetical protein
MSKLEERLPDVYTSSEERIELAGSVVDAVQTNGRVTKAQIVEEITRRLASERLGEDVILREARKGIAEQFASAWANAATIRFDRKQRLPVYHSDIGFAGSWFKIGSVFVQPASMTVQDFETLLERLDRRISNAQVDRSIVSDFYERARPGLEAGQNLVEQFESGQLELYPINGDLELGDGEEDDDDR